MAFLRHFGKLMKEFLDFAKHHKAWWIIPIVILLLLLTILIVAGSSVAPLIYPLF
jgi:uncharacterized integral membrane protein